MKAFLFLAVLSAQGLIYEKIEIKNFTNCDKAYESIAVWQDNPNYTDGNGEIWGYYVYNKKPIVASYCKDQEGNWLL